MDSDRDDQDDQDEEKMIRNELMNISSKKQEDVINKKIKTILIKMLILFKFKGKEKKYKRA